MADKEYYERWLTLKEQFRKNVEADITVQELAKKFVGIKPQNQAVEIVARVYCRYCDFYNKLCDCYDQMTQIQRRPYIKKVIEALTCRILELKRTLEEVEAFEFTYPDNALQQMLMIPEEVQIMCPFFYPFEIREKEMQYIIDEIMAGNRIGDPTPTPSEVLRQEEERLAEEERIREEKEAEIKRKMAMGEDIVESEPSIVLSPAELEELRFWEEYNRHLNNIQRMERSRVATREKVKKINKDANMYLELAGTKAPAARDELRDKATALIQLIYRRFIQFKREKLRESKLREKIGMVIPSWTPPSFKIQLEKVKADRRKYREKYYQEWINENIKEKSRVLRLREGDIMEDISAEIRQWLQEWYKGVRMFDEFPWPDEGGSILIVRGDTFTIEEYAEWRTEEEKRLKADASNPKSKEQIKAEKLAAKLEKKRIEMEARERQKKMDLDYKKSRLKPENDPGVYFKIGENLAPLLEAWNGYQTQWKDIDTPGPDLDVIRRYLKILVTEDAYRDAQFQLRPIVDEMMKLELNLLKNSLKADYLAAGIDKLPLVRKRKKPKVVKPPKPPKITPAAMFQDLVDQGIIKQYPKTTLEDYWGDKNYASADTRSILWTPYFPPPCMGDVKEQIRVRCLMTMGCECPNAERVHLIVGPKAYGKRTLVYAIATETNAILMDLSPLNVYNKYPGKNLKTMFMYVNKISRMMQPTIILVDGADKMFYKKVPKEEKMFDPTRLQKDFFKEIVKPIRPEDKILVIGTASEPWLCKNGPMYKVFPSLIMLPRTDYGSICLILTQMLMKYHGVNREFNVHSVAQTIRGFDINTIRSAVNNLMKGDRVPLLYHIPLHPSEVVSAVMTHEGGSFTDAADYDMFKEWYLSYSPWGEKYIDYMFMLDSQLQFKLKADKKKKG